MTVEDICCVMYSRLPILNASKWDADFITNITYVVDSDKTLSSAQADTLIRIAKRYRSALADNQPDMRAIDAALKDPKFRRQPFTSVVVPREVRYAGQNMLAFRFKNIPSIKDAIRKKLPHSAYNPALKVTLVRVTAKNYNNVQAIIDEHAFAFDQQVVDFLTDFKMRSEEQPNIALVDGYLIADIPDDEYLASFFEMVLDGTPL